MSKSSVRRRPKAERVLSERVVLKLVGEAFMRGYRAGLREQRKRRTSAVR